jgi:hypothetical protein
MLSGISTKDLLKARRNAERKRASVACIRCKAAKTKCSDYRPCKKCKYSNMAGGCVDEVFSTPHPADTRSSSALADAGEHEWCMGNGPFVVQDRFPPDRVSTASDFHTSSASAFGSEIPHPYSAGRLTSRPASGAGGGYQTTETAELKKARNNNEPGEASQEPTRHNLLILGSHVSTVTGLLENSVLAPSPLDSPPPNNLPNIPPNFHRTHCSQTEPYRLLSQQMQYTQEPDPHYGTTWPFPPTSSPPFALPLAALTLPPTVALAPLNNISTRAGQPRLATSSINASLLLALLAAGAAQAPFGEVLAPFSSLLRR